MTATTRKPTAAQRAAIVKAIESDGHLPFPGNTLMYQRIVAAGWAEWMSNGTPRVTAAGRSAVGWLEVGTLVELSKFTGRVVARAVIDGRFNYSVESTYCDRPRRYSRTADELRVLDADEIRQVEQDLLQLVTRTSRVRHEGDPAPTTEQPVPAAQQSTDSSGDVYDGRIENGGLPPAGFGSAQTLKLGAAVAEYVAEQSTAPADPAPLTDDEALALAYVAYGGTPPSTAQAATMPAMRQRGYVDGDALTPAGGAALRAWAERITATATPIPIYAETRAVVTAYLLSPAEYLDDRPVHGSDGGICPLMGCEVCAP